MFFTSFVHFFGINHVNGVPDEVGRDGITLTPKPFALKIFERRKLQEQSFLWNFKKMFVIILRLLSWDTSENYQKFVVHASVGLAKLLRLENFLDNWFNSRQ